MRIERGTFKSPADGIDVYAVAVLPDGEPKAIVQLAHGMLEHKERYLPFMEYLAGRGYLCCINDHRGHGETSRDSLGYFGAGGGEALVEDMHELTKLLKKGHEKLPFFLFGHSMGSLAVRAYTKRYDSELDGLIVCGCPSKNPGAGVGYALVNVLAKVKGERGYSKMIHKMVDGGFNKKYEKLGDGTSWTSSDPSAVKAYVDDPLCSFWFTLNGYKSLLWLMRECYSKRGWAMDNPELPILFVSGGDDVCRISDRKLEDAARHLRDRGYDLPEVRIWPGMRHEILNERDKDKVFRDLGDTLDEWTEKAANGQ